jgi:hypothetical protein
MLMGQRSFYWKWEYDPVEECDERGVGTIVCRRRDWVDGVERSEPAVPRHASNDLALVRFVLFATESQGEWFPTH